MTNKRREFYLDRIVREARRQLKRNPKALEYIASRGVSPEQIDEFQLGYIPADKWPPYIDVENDPGVTPDEQRYWEKSYKGALLKGKLIFPITNAMGMIKAIQARSPDTTKKDYWKYYSLRAGVDAVFFGTRGAMSRIWETREVYLVEGIFDIFPVQRIFPNTLCVGTASLDEAQVKFLRRYVDSVQIMFDNDEQGRRFFQNFYRKYRQDFHHIQQVSYAGKDPSESWDRLGPDKFERQFEIINSLQKHESYSRPLFEG